ncbi:hypothetical protein ABPG72_017493 [Tetrahymena utriculariae]
MSQQSLKGINTLIIITSIALIPFIQSQIGPDFDIITFDQIQDKQSLLDAGIQSDFTIITYLDVRYLCRIFNQFFLNNQTFFINLMKLFLISRIIIFKKTQLGYRIYQLRMLNYQQGQGLFNSQVCNNKLQYL